MIFDAVWNYILFQLAGIWTILAGYGIGAVLIAGCLALAYFSPIWKQHFLWGAAVIGIAMFVYGIGVDNGAHRVQAQWDLARAATAQKAKKARAAAVRDVNRKPSRWVPNNRVDPDQRD